MEKFCANKYNFFTKTIFNSLIGKICFIEQKAFSDFVFNFYLGYFAEE